jgi:hypothetical protein
MESLKTQHGPQKKWIEQALRNPLPDNAIGNQVQMQLEAYLL